MHFQLSDVTIKKEDLNVTLTLKDRSITLICRDQKNCAEWYSEIKKLLPAAQLALVSIKSKTEKDKKDQDDEDLMLVGDESVNDNERLINPIESSKPQKNFNAVEAAAKNRFERLHTNKILHDRIQGGDLGTALQIVKIQDSLLMKGMMCNDQKDTREYWDKLGVLAGTREPEEPVKVEEVQIAIGSNKKEEQAVQNRRVERVEKSPEVV